MTGIQDATTFPDYHCFASNQTGNTIFLTLAIILPSLNGEMFITSNIGVALAFFSLEDGSRDSLDTTLRGTEGKDGG